MEAHKRILVIDDEWQSRNHDYENSLGGHYEVLFAEDADNIYNIIKESQADIFIVDLDLTQFLDPRSHLPMDICNVLGEIGTSKPIILLSGNYRQLMEQGRLTPIISHASEKGYNVGSFLTMDEIRSASESENKILNLKSKIDFTIEKDRSPFAFGIVCALQEELKPFMDKAIPESFFERNVDGVRYRGGVVKNQTGKDIPFVAACPTEMGIADAGIITTNMVCKFNVKTIYMVGVCGGRESEGVNIGDVIIPKESVAFQRGKLTEKGFSSEIQFAKPKEKGLVQYSKADDILSQLFTDYTNIIREKEHRTLALEQPKVNYNVMACADYVIDKEGELDVIAKNIGQRKLCAVDMESYAIFRVGEILDIDTMVIKSVMDLTSNKSDKYKPYAAYMAANYLYQLIYQGVIGF